MASGPGRRRILGCDAGAGMRRFGSLSLGSRDGPDGEAEVH